VGAEQGSPALQFVIDGVKPVALDILGVILGVR
jgi:hypothetical protein